MTERARPPISLDIRHGERYDVLVNLAADDPMEAQRVAGMVEEGISGWHHVIPSNEPRDSQFYVDHIPNPLFIAKTSHPLRRRLTPADVRAIEPITRELILAPEIKNILRSKRGREIGSRYGVPDLRYIEPLVGIIDREKKRKVLVYKYYKGWDTSVAIPPGVNLFGLSRDLKKHFGEEGIDAADLGVNQWIKPSGEEGAIYLLDAELYRRKDA